MTFINRLIASTALVAATTLGLLQPMPLAAKGSNQVAFTLDNIYYEVRMNNTNTAVVMGYSLPESGCLENVTIPSKAVYEEVEYTVDEIGVEALKDLKVESITLPASLKTIDAYGLAKMGIRSKTLTIPASVNTLGYRALPLESLSTVSFLGRLPKMYDLSRDWSEIAIGLRNEDVSQINSGTNPMGKDKLQVRIEIDPALGIEELHWKMTRAIDDVSTAILQDGMTMLLPPYVTVRFILPDSGKKYAIDLDGVPVFDSTGTASVSFTDSHYSTLRLRPSDTSVQSIGHENEDIRLFRLDGTSVQEASPAPGFYLRVTPNGCKKILIQ